MILPDSLQCIQARTPLSAALKALHVVQAGAAHVDEEECTCEASIMLPLEAPRVLLLRLAEQAAADAPAAGHLRCIWEMAPMGLPSMPLSLRLIRGMPMVQYVTACP